MIKIIKNLIVFMVLLILPFSISAQVNKVPAALWITDVGDSRPMLFIDKNIQYKLISVNKTENNEAEKFSVNLTYPQISGVNLDKNAKLFNQKVTMLIQQPLNQFKKMVSPEISKAFPADAQSYFKLNYQLASFMSASQNTKYISIRFNIEAFALGMAHPYHSFLVMNYDLGHNKMLSLSDLFKPNSNYLSVIAHYCIKQLQAKHLSDTSMIVSGAAPRINNYKNWNLTLSGLLISFEEGQVAPRYDGAMQILIPKAVLAPLVNHLTACTISILRCDKT